MAQPVFETLKLPVGDNELGPGLEALRQWLARQHNAEPITHLYFEAPLLPRGRVAEDPKGKSFVQNFTRIESVALAFGLAAFSEWFATCVDATCRQVQQGAWRKHFTGRGSGKTVDLKREAIERARALGWAVKNDHEADAGGVLSYGLACMGVEPPWRDALMFKAMEAAK